MSGTTSNTTTRVGRMLRLGTRCFGVLGISLGMSSAASAIDLNQKCVVNVMNRTVQVQADGTWEMLNVPANMGRVRARVTCVDTDGTVSGETAFFNVTRDARTQVGSFKFEETAPAPVSLQFSFPTTIFFRGVGETYQLQMTAFYADGSSADVSAADSGINYRSSNPATVTVSADGLLQGVSSGTVLITARLDGAVAVKRVRVMSVGDADNDGLPDDYEIANGMDPNDPIDAQEDLDRDGLSALEEYQLGTKVNDADSDKDGINDGEEVIDGSDGFTTDPLLADTDGDGLNDHVEVLVGSSPVDAQDTDLQGALDTLEVRPSSLVMTFNSVDNEVSEQLRVLGHLIDGSLIDLTDDAQTRYTSTDLTKVNFGATAGQIFGSQPGTATVNVSSYGYDASVSVEVKAFAAVALSALDMPGYANNVDVAGDYAYVAAGAAGLVVVDVSDREHPFIVSTLDTAGTSIDVRIVGNLAYVADGEAGLVVADVSDPLNPTLVSSYDTVGSAQDVKVDFKYAYVADGVNGLVIIDISDPSRPVGAGHLSGLDVARGVDAENGTVVVVGGSALYVVDAGDARAPTLQGSIGLGSVKDVVMSGSYAYVAAYNSGFKVVDISTPTAPVEVAGGRGFVPRDVELTEGLAFFAEQIFPNVTAYVNIQDPANAVFQGTIDLSGLGDFAGTGIALDSSYAYVTEESYVVSQDYKATGTSRLFIAQYRLIQDNLGIPPTVRVASPTAADVLVEGERRVVSVEASDDVAVGNVSFIVDGVTAYTDTTRPYQTVVEIPAGVDSIRISAVAVDLGGNVGRSEEITIAVQPDADGDGLGDQYEVDVVGTLADDPDSDDDNLNDGLELVYGTDPLDPDSDDDGLLDGDEVAQDTDPLNPDVTAPEVAQVNPAAAAVDVPESTQVEIGFNEELRLKSVKPGVVVLADGNGTAVAAALSLAADGRTLILRPNALLQDYTEYFLTVSGLQDGAGNPMAAPFTSSFTTGNVVDEEAPQIQQMNPPNYATDVPTNSVLEVYFDEPLDANTVTADTFYVYDTSAGERIPGSLQLSDDRRKITFTPDLALAVGRQHYVYVYGVADPFGNTLNTTPRFTTAFVADGSAPEVVATSITDGLSSVPTNARLRVLFSEPVNGLKLTGVTLSLNGEAQALSRELSSDHRELTLATVAPLSAGAQYSMNVAGIEDLSGNVLAHPITVTFTVGSEQDTTSPARRNYTPYSNAITGTNPLIAHQYGERIDPTTIDGDSVRLYDVETGQWIAGSRHLSADGTTVSFVPDAALIPGHRYQPHFGYYDYLRDLAGNTASYRYWTFTVAGSSDNSAPQIGLRTIADGASDVPVNARLRFTLSEPFDPLCVDNAAIALSSGGQAVAGSVAYGSDYRTVTFTPEQALDTSTQYTFSIDGVCDLAGNPLASSSFGFTTSALADTDTSDPVVLSMSPAHGATGVRGDTSIVLTFDEPIDPTTVDDIEISIDGSRVAGNLSVDASQTVVTFTPNNAFPADSRVSVYFNSLTDLAGNDRYWSKYFDTSAEVVDTSAPTIVGITPNDGAVDVDRVVDVVLNFSESLDYRTVNNDSFALFANGQWLSTSVSRSTDNRTVTLSASVPASSLMAVVVSSDVKDLSGNALADFVSLYTTTADGDFGRPSIVSQYPGSGANGVARERSIVMYANESLDGASLASGFHVSQNGVLVNGSVTVHDDGHSFEFSPDQPWAYGAYVEVFATSAVTDQSGNALNNFQGSFRVMDDPLGGSLTLVARSPGYGITQVAVNPVMEFLFNKALDEATVVPEQIGMVDYETGAQMPLTLSLDDTGRVLRAVPQQALEPGHRYRTWVSVADVQGNEYNNSWAGWLTAGDSAELDQVGPRVVSMSPPDGSANVGVNARIHVRYDEPVSPVSVGAGTVDGMVVASLNFNTDNDELSFVPHVPFAADSTVTVAAPSGATDYAGNPATAHSVSFQTASGPDLSAPLRVEITPYDGLTTVPVNAVLRVRFDEPLDPVSITADSFYVYHYNYDYGHVAGTTSLSDNGHLLTFVPDSPWLVNERYDVDFINITDLAGNTYYNTSWDFTTVGESDLQAPQVSGFSIVAGLNDVPTNVMLKVDFDEALNELSLAGVKLYSGGVEVATRTSFSADHRQVQLTPMQPLAANTAYSMEVSGVQDLSGNVLAQAVSRSFTTGTGADLVAPQRGSYTPYSNAVTGATPVIAHRYDERIDPTTVDGDSVRLYDVETGQWLSGTRNISADGMTVSFVPDAPLTPGHRYQPHFGYYSYLRDLAGSSVSYRYWTFTVGSAADVQAPAVALTTVADGAGAIPVNARLRVDLSEPFSPLCADNTTVRLSGAGSPVTGALSYSSDYRSFTFTPDQPLAVSSAYTLSLDGVCDLSGNGLPTVSYAFTTSASADADTSDPVVAMTPTPNSTGVRGDTAVVFTFEEPIDPTTLSGIQVTVDGSRVAGSLSVDSSQTVVTFTPNNAFPANQRVYVYFSGVTDLAGNDRYWNQWFDTSADVVDTTAPTVIGITPNDGATDVDRRINVVLSFSESLDYRTINSDNFALFANGEWIGTSVSRSTDNRTVTLSAGVPESALMAVVVSSGVKDLSGNAMTDFVSLYTSSADSDVTRPRIVTQYPASGASEVARERSVVLYADEPLAQASLGMGLQITQDGALVSGSVTIRDDGHSIEFTPDQPWPYGAYVEVFATSGISDVAGNALQSHQGSFRVENDPATSNLSLQVRSPSYGGSGVALNPVQEFLFNKPLDPASVDASRVIIYDYDNGGEIAANVSLDDSGRVLRVSAAGALAAQTRYRTWVSVDDQYGHTYSDSWAGWFTTGDYTENDALGPQVQGMSPPHGSTDVGVNARVHVRYDEPVSPVSVGSTTVDGTIVASLNFSSDNKELSYVPHAPWAPSSAVTVTAPGAATDYAGNAATPYSVTFQTAAGPDLSSPQRLEISPYDGSTNVAVNAVVQVRFDEPLDPVSVTQDSFKVYRYTDYQMVAGSIGLSDDGRLLSFVPAGPWEAGQRFDIDFVYVSDLAGNTYYNTSAEFNTVAQEDLQAPQVTGFSVVAGLTAVPTNVQLKVDFDEPLNELTLSGVRLYSGGVEVPTRRSFSTDHRQVQLLPTVPLAAHSAYSMEVSGVQDLSGNTLLGTVSRSFTTGAGADLLNPQRSVYTPYSNAVTGTNPVISHHYSERMDPTTVNTDSVRLYDLETGGWISGSRLISDDGTMVSFVPDAPLELGHRYQPHFGYYSYLRDLAGNTVSSRYWTFTVSEAADDTAPSVQVLGIKDGQLEVPVNARARVRFSEAMSPACVTNAAPSLSWAGGQQAMELGYDSTYHTLTLTPTSALLSGTSYTLSLAGLCDLSGNPLPVSSTSFSVAAAGTIDTTSPVTVTMTPAPNATDAAVDTSIVFDFDEVIDPTTIDGIGITVNSADVPGTLSVDASRTRITFTPDQLFNAGERVYVYYSSVADLAGNTEYWNKSFYITSTP